MEINEKNDSEGGTNVRIQQVNVVREVGGPLPVDREQLVVKYIDGEIPVPEDLAVLVRRYREYALRRADCVSYPREEDERMNRVYDALVALA